jgi:hypothetical protein
MIDQVGYPGPASSDSDGGERAVMSEVRFSGDARVQVQRNLGSDWQDVADFFQVKPHVKARWPQGDEPSRLWDYLQDRGLLPELPAALALVGRDDLAGLLTAEPSPSARPRRKVFALVSIVAVLMLAGGSVLWWKWPHRGPAPHYAKLQILPPPTTVSWGDKLTCPARTQWPNTFPKDYVGDVYVLFTADARKAFEVRASLYWGGMTWRQTVQAKPGDMDRRLGGTMLVFQKQTIDRGKPAAVFFETDIPVCATFGTASDPTVAYPGVSLSTPHWN